MRQREVTTRWAWFYLGYGTLLVMFALIRDWSTWPDLRTILGALMGLFGVAEIAVGLYVLRRAARRKRAIPRPAETQVS
jgi:uncharacterized membrane protein